MNKLPELPDYSRDMEIVQALQRLSGADTGLDANPEDEEGAGAESGPTPRPS